MISHRLMDLDLLRTFCAVIDAQSFTAAASELNITQQSVSAQIKRLEEALQRRLLERSPKGVQLTQDGEALLVYAKELLKISARINRHFTSTPLRGKLKVGFLECFASHGLTMALTAMRLLQPTMEISAFTGRTQTLMQRFGAGELDIVLGGQREGAGLGQPLWRNKLSWVGDACCLNAEDGQIPLVVLPAPSFLRELMISGLKNSDLTWSIAFESDSRLSLRSAAVAGLGLTVFADKIEEQSPDRLLPLRSDLLPDPGQVEFFLLKTEEHRVQAVAEVIHDLAPSLLDDQPTAF